MIFIFLSAIPTRMASLPIPLSFNRRWTSWRRPGGGTLVVDHGRYALGGLRIGSNTCLSPGAKLIVSENGDDFTQAVALSQAECSHRAFLYALDAQNVSICGGGEIYGSADGWFSRDVDAMGYRQPVERRPRIIFWRTAAACGFENITVRHAPMWTIHLVSCIGVTINRIAVDNDLTMANTDALDIDSCQQVHIANCYSSAASGAICLKTTAKPAHIQRPLRQVTIVNCTLRSKSCALNPVRKPGRILKMCWSATAPSLIPIAGSACYPATAANCGG